MGVVHWLNSNLGAVVGSLDRATVHRLSLLTVPSHGVPPALPWVSPLVRSQEICMGCPPKQ